MKTMGQREEEKSSLGLTFHGRDKQNARRPASWEQGISSGRGCAERVTVMVRRHVCNTRTQREGRKGSCFACFYYYYTYYCPAG